ncbi:MAG: hypothetical protein IJ716_01820 [Lachnospiraceae bacterium]|nr:hypothetical protein [Lachnospiraceae bacterium]
MIALEIISVKNFMKHLLSAETFDDFLLEECTISTSNTYTIDGHMNSDFFPPEERTPDQLPYAFRPWSELKGLCFDLIKGKYTPLFFKFVLQLKPEKAAELTQNAEDAGRMKALVLNIRYDGNKVLLTTGTSYTTFVMSKEIDLRWDQYLCRYLEEKGIGYEKL